MDSVKLVANIKGTETELFVETIDFVQAVNRIAYVQIGMLDDNEYFTHNAAVELDLKGKIFKGIVTRQIRKIKNGRINYIVDIKDHAVNLTASKKSRVFDKSKDKKIIESIVAEYDKENLTCKCDDTEAEHEQLVQHYCTDWDFIVSRAESNGLLVYTKNGEISIVNPEDNSSAQAVSISVNDIMDMELDTDLFNHYNSVEASSCQLDNYDEAYVNIKGALPGSINSSIQTSGQEINERLFSGIYAQREELQSWADAAMMRNQLSRVRGRISLFGNFEFNLLNTIKIEGIAGIESTSLITGIRHRIYNKQWVTDLQLGLDQTHFANRIAISSKPAANLLPGINGMHIGIVQEKDKDDNYNDRIKVKVHSLGTEKNIIWARCLFSVAGPQRGTFFIPEVADEVIVGFLNDDPRHAVILGSLYSHKSEIPYEVDTTENEYSGIVTKNGMKLEFRDKEKEETLELSTPGDEFNKILLENIDGQGISIEDKNGNSMILAEGAITIKDNDEHGGNIVFSKDSISVKRNDNTEINLDDNNILLKVNNSSIELSDSQLVINVNGNTIKLDGSGIKVESESNIEIKTSANVTINGSSGIDLN